MPGFSPPEFPTPKTELVQKFQVLYLGMLPVARPIGEFDTWSQANTLRVCLQCNRTCCSLIVWFQYRLWFECLCFCLVFTSSGPGMDILNGAIDSLIGSSTMDDWTPVALNVADATVTISKDKVSHTAALLLHISLHLLPTIPFIWLDNSLKGLASHWEMWCSLLCRNQPWIPQVLGFISSCTLLPSSVAKGN